MRRPISTSRRAPRGWPRTPLRFDILEDRTVPSTVLGTKPLVFDPPTGPDVPVGQITFVQDGNDLKVTYAIDGAHKAQYDLSAVHTTINIGTLGDENDIGLPDGTDSWTQTLVNGLILPDSETGFTIDACATIAEHNAAAVGANLPTVGTVQVLGGGGNSYWDTVLTPGKVPSSTDVTNDTVTFAADPLWSTGNAVRVVANFGAAVTGLVTPPGTSGASSTSPTYYIRNLGGGTYSFHTTYAGALANTGLVGITAAIPTTGEIVVLGENDSLGFLGQVPVNPSQVPASTKPTFMAATGPTTVTSFNASTEVITVPSTAGFTNGDRYTVSNNFGGATTTTAYFVRKLSGTTISLYNSFTTANTGGSSGRINLSATPALVPGTTLNPVDPDDETVTFAVAPVPAWATGDPVRVSATGGGLTAGTTYYVRAISPTTFAFYDTAANANAVNPANVTGRKDLSPAVTASVFPNPTKLTFALTHNWATGTAVRVSATGGGLSQTTAYYVRAIDANTVSLHTTSANAASNTSPIAFTAPITALVSQVFESWCVDVDRSISPSGEYTAVFYSSYDPGSFVNTSTDPKPGAGTETGIMPVNTGKTPGSTNTTTDVVTFTGSHGWATGQAVQVTATGGGLVAGTTYYVRTSGGTAVSFHATPAGAAANTGKVDLTSPGLTTTTTVFRAQSIDFAVNHNWPTGTRVRVDITSGLTAGTDYYIRSVGAKTVSFHPTEADALANTNVITFSGPIDPMTKVFVFEKLVEKPENLDVVNWVLNQNLIGTDSGGGDGFYTSGDIQRAIWELIENNPNTLGLSPWSPARVAKILAAANTAGVTIGSSSVDFYPDCGGTVAVIARPYEVNQASKQQVTVGQITVAEIPNYCREGTSCEQLILTPGLTINKVVNASVLNFDDFNLSAGAETGPIGLYQGFQFTNTGVYHPSNPPGTGYQASSPANIAFIGSAFNTLAPGYPGIGLPVTIASPGGDFTFVSANFSAAFRDGLTLKVQAYDDGSPKGGLHVYTINKGLNLITFSGPDFQSIDKLEFISNDLDGSTNDYFGFDDFTYLPEASAAGQKINYTISVTNTSTGGPLGLTGVTVTDPLTGGATYVGGDTNTNGVLDTTETWVYAASYAVTQADIDLGDDICNTASVNTNQTPPSSDHVCVPVDQNPGFEILKSADVTSVDAAGDKITYTITVHNTGNVSLTGVTVDDPYLGGPLTGPAGDGGTAGVLDVGETWTYTVVHTVTQAEMDQNGNALTLFALGLPSQVTISNLQNPGGTNSYWDVTISGGGILDGTYDDWCIDTDHTIGSGPYTADVYSSYETLPPGLVEHPENLDLVNWIINQNFTAGGYTFGDVQKAIWTLVEDDYSSTAGLGAWDQDRVNQILALAHANGEGFAPGCGQFAAVVLVPVNGQQVTIAQVTVAGITLVCHPGCIYNMATADTAQTGPGSDDECTEVVQTPDFVIQKTGVVGDGSADEVGDVITYTITVHNTGNVSLTGVTVVDSLDPTVVYVSGDAGVVGVLDVGETWTFAASYAVTQADLDAGEDICNTATADTIQTGPKSDEYCVPVVQNPDFEIVKTADVTEVDAAGDKITYTITVTNTGNVSLTGVTAADPYLGSLSGPVESGVVNGVLDVGEVWTYSGTHVVTQAEMDQNGNGLTLFAQALPGSVTMVVSYPGTGSYLDVTVSGGGVLNGTYQDWCIDTTRNISPGTYYTAAVYSSLEDLPDSLGVQEQNLDLVNWVINNYTAGGTYSVDDIQTAIWGLMGQVAPPTGGGAKTIYDAALASGNGFVPGCGQSVAVVLVPVDGNNQNTVQITIAQITFADVEVPCHPGEICNTATADTDQTGPDSDDECVAVVQTPGLNVLKTASVAGGTADHDGEVITYTITVTNTGNVGLPYVTVEDYDDYGAVALSGPTGDTDNDGILDVGEVWTYTGTHTVDQAELELAAGLPAFAAALPSTVQMTVGYPGTGSYLDVAVTGGSLTGTYQDWCIDTAHYITPGTEYTANVYSSYGAVPDFPTIDESNLDLVNWVINQGFVGNGYTVDDVQQAIWDLTGQTLNPNGSPHTPIGDATRVAAIVAAAHASGEGFVPACGDSVAVILAPTDGTSQVTIAQVTFAAVVLDACDPAYLVNTATVTSSMTGTTEFEATATVLYGTGHDTVTFTQDGYAGTGAAATYLNSNFAAAFGSSGLVVPWVASMGDDVVLHNATEVQVFLNGSASDLEKQFVALTLNVAFDAGLGDLELGGLTGALAPANGLTVSDFLAQVYDYLDGDSGYTLGLSAADLTALLGEINGAFDAGEPSTWALAHLS